MKAFLFAAMAAVGVLLAPSVSQATCVGSSTYQSCFDGSGNSYSVQRFGNTTMMQGNNARTGSSWTQNSQTIGNTTFHSGTTNGRSWKMQQQNIGGGTSYSGSDSRGRSFNHFCYGGSCN